MRYRPRAKARPRQPKQGMNKTESAYADRLGGLLAQGMIEAFQYEPIRLKLAGGTCTYTPDFMVVMPNGEIEFHEVKAATSKGVILAEDDAIVKIKVAAELYWMFGFRIFAKLPIKIGGGSKERTF